MSKKIFITGCAKSGTTLLLRMFYAFKNTEVLYRRGFDGHELSFDKFIKYKSDEMFVVGKRHPPSLLSNVLLPGFEEQHKTIKEQNVGIINVVRDGRDVILSDGKWVKPRRWIESVRQRGTFRDIIDLEVRYEDLINNPQKVQNEIEQRFGLESKHKFKNYPDYVEDWVFEWNVSVLARSGDESAAENYGKRKLSTKSIGKDLLAYKEICDEFEIPAFESCLRQLSYI
tara:strand:- start:32 stop:715 length:684 start_codon:yes stop_codon:yes gene_type:complete